MKPKEFMFAGNAFFTLSNEQSKKRYTYRIKQSKKNEKIFFASVLTGPDNISNYSFIGTIFMEPVPYTFRWSPKSWIKSDAESVRGMTWLMTHLDTETWPGFMKIRHEGKCGRCGRKLTVPESIDSGIGPECAKRG